MSGRVREPIVIYSREEGYARGLLLQMSRMHFPISDCVILTKLELLKEMLKRPVELLIAAEDAQKLLPGRQVRCTVLLSEGKYTKEGSPFPCVYKYQSMEQVMSEVLAIYSEVVGNAISLNYTGDEKKKVIGVYSPSSGLSRTMFALALAREYARNWETLYLPFEAFSAETLLDSRGGMSDLIYYLREKSPQIGMRIQMMAHKEEQLSYLAPVGHYLDVNEATSADFRYLVRELRENSPYEVCILEIGYFNHHVASLMNECDEIYLPYEDMEDALGEPEEGKGERKVQAFHRAVMEEGMPQLFTKLIPIPIPVAKVDWSKASEALNVIPKKTDYE